MDKIEKIKKRIETGYTMSVYGTKEHLYFMMLKDIRTLMLHIDKQKLPIDLVIWRCTMDLFKVVKNEQMFTKGNEYKGASDRGFMINDLGRKHILGGWEKHFIA